VFYSEWRNQAKRGGEGEKEGKERNLFQEILEKFFLKSFSEVATISDVNRMRISWARIQDRINQDHQGHKKQNNALNEKKKRKKRIVFFLFLFSFWLKEGLAWPSKTKIIITWLSSGTSTILIVRSISMEKALLLLVLLVLRLLFFFFFFFSWRVENYS